MMQFEFFLVDNNRHSHEILNYKKQLSLHQDKKIMEKDIQPPKVLGDLIESVFAAVLID